MVRAPDTKSPLGLQNPRKVTSAQLFFEVEWIPPGSCLKRVPQSLLAWTSNHHNNLDYYITVTGVFNDQPLTIPKVIEKILTDLLHTHESSREIENFLSDFFST